MFYSLVPSCMGGHGGQMPANQEPKQEETIKDHPASPDLEITAEELESEDADSVAGGGGIVVTMSH